MPRSSMILSLAEWEYAHRYRDYLTIGDEKPDSAGFDSARIHEIEQTISAEYHSRRDATFGRIKNRVHGR